MPLSPCATFLGHLEPPKVMPRKVIKNDIFPKVSNAYGSSMISNIIKRCPHQRTILTMRRLPELPAPRILLKEVQTNPDMSDYCGVSVCIVSLSACRNRWNVVRNTPKDQQTIKTQNDSICYVFLSVVLKSQISSWLPCVICIDWVAPYLDNFSGQA